MCKSTDAWKSIVIVSAGSRKKLCGGIIAAGVGDSVNAVMSAAGMNFRKLIRWLTDFFALILGVPIWRVTRKYPPSPAGLILCPQ